MGGLRGTEVVSGGPAGPCRTEVTLSYDWSAVPDSIRRYSSFPPFAPDHLGNSLAHLADLAAR